ncbi:hypothetical protein RQM28_011520 [Citrobacter freundii]|uniref:hypothetical protein n=1 Tax=Citrobacter freundii TaxID=546 RepID=UPI0028BDE450|nr:hypothetical protein [Citrobacter freundii]MDT7335573.1 hypothetical protein [Citrobacter freundii]
MNQIKILVDQFGIIYEASKLLPNQYKIDFLNALAELEDNVCHTKRSFPITRLHRVTGQKKAIYRADIDKISGWRLHVQYEKETNSIILKDIIDGQKHDDVTKVIKAKRGRYS